MSKTLKSTSPMVDWALAYVKVNGWHIFPVHTVILAEDGRPSCSCSRGVDCTAIGKHPRIAGGVLNASNDPRQIVEWWTRWPNANIGVAAGKSGLYVIDDDCAKNGFDSLTKLAEEGRSLPATWRQRTGSGGFHHIYQAPETLNQPNGAANVLKEAGYPGIDTRYGHGYVLLAPSTHVSGERYKLIKPDPLAAAPEWFIEMEAECRSRHRLSTPAPASSSVLPRVRSNGGQIESFMEGWVDGSRDDTICKLAGSMLGRHIHEDVAVKLIVGLTRLYADQASAVPDAETERKLRSHYARYAKGSEEFQSFETEFQRGEISDKDETPTVQYWGRKLAGHGYKWGDGELCIRALIAMNPEFRNVSDETIRAACVHRERIDVTSDRQTCHTLAMQALAEANKRGDALGTIYRTPDGGQWRTVRIAADSLHLSTPSRDAIAGRLQACARWGKLDQHQVWISKDIPKQVLGTVYSAPEHDAELISGDLSGAFPILGGVMTTPMAVLDEDGCIASMVSEHPVYIPSIQSIIRMPSDVCAAVNSAAESPSKEAAMEAVRKLRGIFNETRFATEADWHKTFALILTIYLRKVINGMHPWGIIAAASQGEGKTTLAEGILAFGSDYVVTKLDSDDEMRKSLVGWLSSGVDGLVLDNLSGVVDSELLSAMITTPVISLRGLYAKSATAFRHELLILGTANNPRIGKDLVSRGIQVRIDGKGQPRLASQYTCTPAIWIRKNRAKCHGWIWDILHHALSVEADASRVQYQTRYPNWEKVIVHILDTLDIRISFADSQLESADTSTQCWNAFIAQWFSQKGDERCSVNELAKIAFQRDGSALTPLLSDYQASYLGHLDDSENVSGTLTRVMSLMLKQHVNRIWEIKGQKVRLVHHTTDNKSRYQLVQLKED